MIIMLLVLLLLTKRLLRTLLIVLCSVGSMLVVRVRGLIISSLLLVAVLCLNCYNIPWHNQLIWHQLTLLSFIHYWHLSIIVKTFNLLLNIIDNAHLQTKLSIDMYANEMSLFTIMFMVMSKSLSINVWWLRVCRVWVRGVIVWIGEWGWIIFIWDVLIGILMDGWTW